MKEDHTLGNLISEHLKMHPKVHMAGYKGLSSPQIMSHSEIAKIMFAVAHPNVPELMIRVQTDGTVTPREVFIEVCKQLIASYGQLGREFTREYELRRMATAGNQDNQPNGS